MQNRKRSIQIIVRVTEQERQLIAEKMKQLPTQNLAAYARKMLIDGYIILLDTQEIKAHAAQPTSILQRKIRNRLSCSYACSETYHLIKQGKDGNGMEKKQEQEHSGFQQKRSMTNKCESGIISSTHCLSGVTFDREGFNQMIAAIEAGKGPMQITKALKADKVLSPKAYSAKCRGKQLPENFYHWEDSSIVRNYIGIVDFPNEPQTKTTTKEKTV